APHVVALRDLLGAERWTSEHELLIADLEEIGEVGVPARKLAHGDGVWLDQTLGVAAGHCLPEPRLERARLEPLAVSNISCSVDLAHALTLPRMLRGSARVFAATGAKPPSCVPRLRHRRCGRPARA